MTMEFNLSITKVFSDTLTGLFQLGFKENT